MEEPSLSAQNFNSSKLDELYHRKDEIMKILFVVQGEGRGHMTQALGLKDLIDEMNLEANQKRYEICEVIVGGGENRPIPDYFTKAFQNIKTIISPSLSFVDGKKLSNLKTSLNFLKNLKNFYRSYLSIKQSIDKHKPDLIINFYEPILSIVNALHNIPPVVAIGHHFLYVGDSFFKKQKHFFDYLMTIQLGIWFCGFKSEKIAISFYPAVNPYVKVFPPLLRKSFYSLKSQPGDFIVVYLLNTGYADQVIDYATKNPEKKIKVFCEKFWQVDDEWYSPHPNIQFHDLDNQLFLQSLASCESVVCSGGFETVCEANYLGKKIMMVPTENHYEQYMNAMNAVSKNMAVYSKNFDLDKLNELKTVTNFRPWFESYGTLYKDLIRKYM